MTSGLRQATRRNGGWRRVIRFVAGVLGVLLLAVVVDVGWALYRHDQRIRHEDREGRAAVLAKGNAFAAPNRPGARPG
jgi:hypothetical protein